MEASSKRVVADFSIFESSDIEKWEEVYDEIMEQKYKKNTRNFSKKITGKKVKEPKIYLIPRERGGESYKKVNLIGAESEDIQFCPISKGFSMQDVSSFTIGPIIGEGLCLVNAAFSKIICIGHIEGGGKVNLKRKNFWVRSKKPDRKIEILDIKYMKVNNKKVEIYKWLKENEGLWLDEWEKWRKSVALCSRGDFHWDNSEVICYRYKDKYLSFVEWKKECYIKPSFELLPQTSVYEYLEKVLKSGVSLGLVHPKARGSEKIKPITEKYLKELFESEEDMCCQPYVVAAKLMNIKID